MRSGLATTDAALADAVRAIARPLASAAAPYRPLLELVGDARLVLLGAASHGTHEFYRERAEITKRLLGERDFTAVAIEGDWPAARRVDHYVRHSAGDRSASEALAASSAFPRGSGATRTWSSSSSGSGPGTRRGPSRPTWPASTASICTTSAPRSRRW